MLLLKRSAEVFPLVSGITVVPTYRSYSAYLRKKISTIIREGGRLSTDWRLRPICRTAGLMTSRPPCSKLRIGLLVSQVDPACNILPFSLYILLFRTINQFQLSVRLITRFEQNSKRDQYINKMKQGQPWRIYRGKKQIILGKILVKF